MITKVVLTNWRSHLQSELEFCEGTNCLIGRMGSGKSSVLDAICFGLFGTFPQLQQKKIKLEDMIMKKPKQQRFAEIRVEFDSNGDACSVKRRIEKGKSAGAEFRKNGNLVETQPKKVSEEVERVLKVDYDLFTRAVYSEQNQLDMFLTIPKGQRMKKIDELLRLDRFESARISAVSLGNRFALHREENEGMLGNMKEEELEKEIETLKAEAEALKQEHCSLVSESEKAAQMKALLREKISCLEKSKEEIRRASERVLLLESLNGQLMSDISALEKQVAAHAGADIGDLTNKTETLKAQISAASQSARESRSRILNARVALVSEKDRLSQLLKLKEEKEKLEIFLGNNNPETIAHELEMLAAEIERKTIDLGCLKNEISGCDFAKGGFAGSKCVVCGCELSDERKKELMFESGKKMETLLAKKAAGEAEIKILVGKRKSVESAASHAARAAERKKEIGDTGPDIEKAKQKIAELSGSIEAAEKEMQEKESAGSLLQPQLESLIRECESAKACLLKKAEIEKKRNDAGKNSAEIAALAENLGRIKKAFSEEELMRERENMETLIGAEKANEAKSRFLNEMISEKQKSLESAEGRKKLAEECALEIRKSAAMEEQLRLLERGLEVSQEQLRRDFIGAINHAMQMVWENLYPYTDFSSARLAIDGDYVLQLQDSNGWVSVDSVSGGERSIACLALRIAFALVLAPQLRWLVLDEPTHNLDEKAVAELANVLRDNMTEFVEQVFLITHDSALEPAVSGFLYRMEKEKEGFTNAVKVDGN